MAFAGQRRSARPQCAATFLVLACAGSLSADIFVLESGGQVEGEWLNCNEQPPLKYEVRRGGVTITFPLSQVRETIRQSPAELEYARRAPVAADTVEEQWQLAEWCRKNS